MRNYNLETRLIEFAISVIDLSKGQFDSYEQSHLFKQLIRSATSPSLMYGEAQGAESQKDFIHKMSIGLKELRESQINLRIIKGAKLCRKTKLLEDCLNECSQLVRRDLTNQNPHRRTFRSILRIRSDPFLWNINPFFRGRCLFNCRLVLTRVLTLIELRSGLLVFEINRWTALHRR